MKLTIPLGKYGLELADLVRTKFNEQRNKHPERSAMRINAHILFRGRGKRNTYVRRGSHPSKWERNARFNDMKGDPNEPIKICGNYMGDLPVEYAQYVCLYLVIDIKKYLLKR